ncbi:putative multidrug resistance ABC transporter ATP-binding/permease protein YheI [Acaryochloris thomasi RCC1774]|uniref:Putative multidrug resistance ABC transporter ATP-binding/permease protein YheI n=1 Tax=Acaryochloris thomasi RCC1774 TaxID=1764569 RepID=A0A2W1K512_9CYAN|nr:ABC transporter ATP-binding protein [Acaryochloris thomasi]PZD75031.1 putative multidrug resistance ABC transporter ATP-binding/permease protein YheI [Acaryochloris thomasi RCC1774]
MTAKPQPQRLKILLGYLQPHRRKVFLGVFALLLVNGLGTYLPLLIGRVVDDLQIAFSMEQVRGYVLQFCLLASVMWVIRMASRMWLFGAGRLVEFDIKQRIFEHLLRLEPSYFATNSAGDLINRATSDVENIRRLVGFSILSIANTTFAYALRLPYMLKIDVSLTLATLAVYPIVMIVVNVFSHRLREQQAAVQNSLSELSQLVQEDMSGMALIKIYAQEPMEQQAFEARNQELLEAKVALLKTRNILFPVVGGFASISLLVLLFFGGRAIASATISVGDFVSLLIYAQQLIFPTAILGFTITAYQRGEVSIDRIQAILSVQPKVETRPDSLPLPRSEVKGQLTARNLTFHYGKERALDRVNFEIQPGEMVAVVGPIGSGKSTLANAIPRLLDIPAEQLFIDGQDITQLALNDLRGAIAYVPQDSFLFSTSLQNNIRYGVPHQEQSDVENAAKQAQVQSDVLTFPKQYQTLVGERGVTLSGGQRQRTSLARALILDAPILILDDSLSSVDNQTATKILQELAHQQKTVLFISHQMSAAAICDRILVMDHGTIVQEGTHTDLIGKPGLYQSLWDKQKLEANLK